MVSEFHNTGLDEGAETLLDMLGESVTYKPASGTQRTIRAIVERDQPVVPTTTAARGRPKASIRIKVKNAKAGGISLSEMDLGGDRVQMPARVGEAATDRPIKSLLSQGFGMLELEVS